MSFSLFELNCCHIATFQPISLFMPYNNFFNIFYQFERGFALQQMQFPEFYVASRTLASIIIMAHDTNFRLLSNGNASHFNFNFNGSKRKVHLFAAEYTEQLASIYSKSMYKFVWFIRIVCSSYVVNTLCDQCLGPTSSFIPFDISSSVSLVLNHSSSFVATGQNATKHQDPCRIVCTINLIQITV